MAKSKKNRQADFQKVKLKVGKKLKKADNVTKTDFKSRKIQVTQQLKTGQETTPSTKKRQNISELFTQCRHYSISVRQEAVTGLRELIASFPDILHAHLADILEKSAELLTDKDPKVRQSAVRLLKFCLPKISEKLIAPFFPLLCAHLCCAMSHIIDDIQVDSLSVLDILLDQYPKLIISVSNQVLSNFIEQISRQKGHSEGKRSLTTNPNSQTSSQKWRKSVFNRLHKFLTAMLNSNINTVGADEEGCEMFYDVSTSLTHVQVFPSYVRHQWESPGFVLSCGGVDQTSLGSAQIAERLQDFAATLMPLMLECWIEAAPSQNYTANTGSQLLPENAAAMYSVLQVTQSLMEALDVYPTAKQSTEVWSKKKYMKECSKHFLSGFPYDIYTPPGKADKKEKKDIEIVSGDLLNLTICDIMCRFLPQGSSEGRQDKPQDMPPWLGAVTVFVQEFLQGRYNRGTVGKCCHTVVKLTNRIIQAGTLDDSLNSILSAMFQRFKGGKRLSQEKQTYLQFFAGVLLDTSNRCIINEEMQTTFLQSLPELLPLAVQENLKMATLIIEVMKLAACQNVLHLMKVDSTQLQQWFAADTGLILPLPHRERMGLLSLLFTLPEVTAALVPSLVSLVQHEDVQQSEVAFLVQTLQNRYYRSGETPEEAQFHILFLCKIVMGPTTKGTNQCKNTPDVYRITIPENPGYSWKRHDFLIQMVHNVLKQCSKMDGSRIIGQILTNYLEKTYTVPLPVAFGICRFSHHISRSDVPLSATVYRLGAAVLMFTYTMANSVDHDPALVEHLQETVGDLITSQATGMDVVRSETQSCVVGADIDSLSAIVKSLQLLLNHLTKHRVPDNQIVCSNIYKAVQERWNQLQPNIQEDSCIELPRLLAEIEYTLATHMDS